MSIMFQTLHNMAKNITSVLCYHLSYLQNSKYLLIGQSKDFITYFVCVFVFLSFIDARDSTVQ